MPFKKGNTLGKGRKRGAKSIVSEAWYQMALRYKDDPEGFGGYEGFRDYFNKSPRNKETYVRMMAGFAEKQIKQAVEHTGEGGGPVRVQVERVITTDPKHAGIRNGD
jgi:hypothetical protein